MSVNVPLRARATLARGVLSLRWAALIWMSVLALTAGPYRRPALAWIGIAVAGVWTVVCSTHGVRVRAVTAPPPFARGGSAGGGSGRLFHVIDLGIAIGLVLISGLVVPDQTVGVGPFYATAYPAASVLAWAVHGMRTGVLAALIVGGAVVGSRPLGGIDLGTLPASQIQTLANGVITYLLAGGAAGLVADLLRSSADAVDSAVERQMIAAQRAARLAEREALGRQIHDSVLQSLALVHKRGREVAQVGKINPADVVALAELAGRQEQELRSLIVRQDQEQVQGHAPLRDDLESLAAAYTGSVHVEVSSATAAVLPAQHAQEIVAAVRQAIDNVIEHANAQRVTIFVDERAEPAGADSSAARVVEVSVRDDGKGFDVAEASGFGLRSMRGRIESIGGTFSISSTPGDGTEVQMLIPVQS